MQRAALPMRPFRPPASRWKRSWRIPIGSDPPVRDAYWSADGRAVYYSLKRNGSPIVDLHRIDPDGGKDQVVDAAAMADADGAVDLRSRRQARGIRAQSAISSCATCASGRLTPNHAHSAIKTGSAFLRRRTAAEFSRRQRLVRARLWQRRHGAGGRSSRRRRIRTHRPRRMICATCNCAPSRP